jgi:hypothetical protein
MSNQSQDNQEIDNLIKSLIKLSNFLYCLVPCYTETNGKRYYALVYYCNEKFKQGGNNNSNNDFVQYIFNGKYYIYLHRDTVNKVGGECQNCNYDIVNNDNYNIWNNLNIELITENINDPDSYKEQDGKKKISIYQIVKHTPTSVFIWEEGELLKPANCNKDMSIFIKDDAYEENINNSNQNQKQKHNTEKLLELKKLLITETTVELSKVINNVIEQQIDVNVDENLRKEAVEIILKNIVDSNDS